MDQRHRVDPQRLCASDQIALVRGKEIEHRHLHPRLAQPRAQIVGAKAGQRQQTLGMVIVGQHPAQRGQGQRSRIGFGGTFAKNGQNLLHGALRGAPVLPLATGTHRDRLMAKRILVVEDNDLNRRLFCDVLKSQGYVVEPVADGREALPRAREFVPNLIIMDIQLPEVSGLDLIEEAKADPVLRQIPVLAVTAYAGKGDEDRIRDAGAEGYLAKPVSIGPFMAAVKALVERAG